MSCARDLAIRHLESGTFSLGQIVSLLLAGCGAILTARPAPAAPPGILD